MTAQPINTAILSFGLSGSVFHAPFLELHSGFNLTTILERNQKKAQSFYPEIKSVDNIDAILSCPEIELVVVNTPNFTHFEYALKAIRAKKHVLIEKPFTVTVSEANQLFIEGMENGVCVLPYQNRRYDTDFSSVKAIIESGVLGKITEVHFRFDRYLTEIGPKKGKETPVPGSGFAYDLGSHALDGVISLFGSPVKWTKTTAHFRPNTQVDDFAHFHLIYPEETQVFVTVNVLAANPQPAFVIHGSNGSFIKHRADVQERQLLQSMKPDSPDYSMEDEGMEGILTTFDKEKTKTEKKVASQRSSYMKLFDCVYDTIRKGSPYPITKEQIFTQLELLEK